MTEEFLPKLVKQRMDELLETTGIAATVTRTGRKWHVEHSNERVKMTCTFTRNSRGTFTYSSTLSVDDKPVELVNNYDQYARLLNDPDNDKPKRRPNCELSPVYPLAEDATVPRVVTKTMEELEKVEDVVSLKVGHGSKAQRERSTAGEWHLNEDDAEPASDVFVVEAAKDNGNRVQLYFLPVPSIPGRWYLSTMAGIDSKNRDLTSEGKSLDELYVELLGIKMPKQNGVNTGAVRPNGDSRGEASNAVTVRRATVIRN